LDVVPVKTPGDYGGSTTPIDIRDLWQTPPQIYNALNAEFHFSVDLAASSVNRLHENYVTAEMDTLKINWVGMFGQAWGWLNPPYSDIGPFVIKAIEQQQKGFGTVMLVPADTSVGWFSLALPSISEVRFITGGRLSFIRADTGKPVNGNNKGSMLLIFSPYKIGARQFGVVDRDVLMAPL
jgi:phage N-6-adenine-methyltransferase